MWRHRLLLAGAITVVVIAGTALSGHRQSRITRQTCGLIPKGMSLLEVEKLVGGPPGDYRTCPSKSIDENGDDWPCVMGPDSFYGWREADSDPDSRTGGWQGDEGYIEVSFTRGVVEGASFVQTFKVRQSPRENLLWRARRLWRVWFPEK
jgi:hypothetical protein